MSSIVPNTVINGVPSIAINGPFDLSIDKVTVDADQSQNRVDGIDQAKLKEMHDGVRSVFDNWLAGGPAPWSVVPEMQVEWVKDLINGGYKWQVYDGNHRLTCFQNVLAELKSEGITVPPVFIKADLAPPTSGRAKIKAQTKANIRPVHVTLKKKDREYILKNYINELQADPSVNKKHAEWGLKNFPKAYKNKKTSQSALATAWPIVKSELFPDSSKKTIEGLLERACKSKNVKTKSYSNATIKNCKLANDNSGLKKAHNSTPQEDLSGDEWVVVPLTNTGRFRDIIGDAVIAKHLHGCKVEVRMAWDQVHGTLDNFRKSGTNFVNGVNDSSNLGGIVLFDKLTAMHQKVAGKTKENKPLNVKNTATGSEPPYFDPNSIPKNGWKLP